MSGKRALTATGPSQSAVAPRQGRRRSVPTEPVADGPFTGPSTATGPFRLVTGPVGTGLQSVTRAEPSQGGVHGSAIYRTKVEAGSDLMVGEWRKPDVGCGLGLRHAKASS